MTLTITITAADGATSTLALPDPVVVTGSAAQYPTLLAGYAVRPSFQVPGVDFAVGMPSGTVLKDPATISMSGVSVSTSTHMVTLTGSNVVISGYDFSLAGGWGIQLTAGSGAKIQNNNFIAGSNGNRPIYAGPSSSNVTLSNNTIDGSAYKGQGVIAWNSPNGTIQNNWLKGAWTENLTLASDTSSGFTMVISGNVVENAGLGYNSGAHGDWFQIYNATNCILNSLKITGNLFLQSVPIATGRTQGLSLSSANVAQGPQLNELVDSNVFIGKTGAYVNYAIIMDTSNLNGTGTISNNYFDLTGIGEQPYGGGWSYVGKYNGGGAGSGPYNGTVTKTNNIDMVHNLPLT